MTRITVDNEILSRLGPLDQPIEFCDETGHTLGFFKPLPDREVYRDLQPLIGRDEIDRRKKEEIGRPLVDVLRDLEGRDE
jgi:hypothetical protein